MTDALPHQERQDKKSTTSVSVERIGFFLAPEFAMLSFAATVEPLRMANRMSGEHLYEWYLFTADNAPVCASNGMDFTPSRTLDQWQDIGTMIVVAGIDAHLYNSPEIKSWFRRLAAQGVNLGATATGSLLLARFGLLKDHTCTIHWENIDSFREEFPRLTITGELYEIDGKYLTCSGGLAGLDMMLSLIGNRHGQSLVKAVAEQCVHPDIRKAHENQRMSLQSKFHINNPRLIKAIEVMLDNLDEQISCQEIAEAASLSTRQLERLFKEHLDTTPNRFYLDQRLDRARILLVQSSLSIVEIASICGFGSTSYFAKCYRARFDHLPREERGRIDPL
ncbi:MAG: transcriptional regulator GlxA family with amidase domain [Motiliproteus sp.]|jgi:transcriptional regulator GlxA family with amidase domain